MLLIEMSAVRDLLENNLTTASSPFPDDVADRNKGIYVL